MLRNVRTLHSLVGVGILAALGGIPLACGDDQFTGCEANRTCPPSGKGGETGGGGEAGGDGDTGGSAGSGRPSTGGGDGTSGADNGGEGGNVAGGSPTGGSSTGGDATGGRATGGTAGTGEDAGAGGEGGVTDPRDRPTIVSVSPADGAIGVYPDVDLVITFSEPMDRESVQLAYTSQDLPGNGVTFFWNAESTILTIDPVDDLALDEVSDPSDVAPNYSLTITDEAADAMGHRLARDFDWTFRTMRRISQTLPVPRANVFTVFSDGTPTRACLDPGVFVGDGSVSTYALVSADISALPAGILQFEVATLDALQVAISGMPFTGPNILGVVIIDNMNVTPPSAATWTTPIAAGVGSFSWLSDLTMRSSNVRDRLSDDYQNRATRSQHSQYRLKFDDDSNDNGVADGVTFACDSFALVTRYYVP